MTEDAIVGKYEKPNLKGDRLNILLLLFMCVLQCLPRGLVNAIPLILQNRKATYQDQAEFSLVSSAYTFKLLWAPIIDCTYSKKIGRRKSWILPMLYLIGILLLIMSSKVDDWMGSEDGTKRPKVHLLTFMFALCLLCASVQDVAVDGWSLTLLKKQNLGYVGACNNIGFSIGQLLGYVTFIVLGSTEFCNYFRTVPQDYAFVQFPDFMFLWSVVLMISTTLIFIFKRDNSLDFIENEHKCRLSLKESYMQLWQIVQIEPVRKTCYILLTCFVCFGPINGVASLKLMDAGVPRDKFALLSVPTILLLCVLPFMMGNYLTKRRSLHTLLVSYSFRLIFDIVYVVFIYSTPYFKDEKNDLPLWYYGILLFCYNVDNLVDYALWISSAAFYNHVSDPRFGATYLTLFNTMTQIGNKWSNTLCIKLVNFLTFRSCAEIDEAEVCETIFDGFYIEVVLATLLGFVWLFWARKQISILEKVDETVFRMKENKDIIRDDDIRCKPLL